MAVHFFEVVGGQAELFEPVHEFGREHLAFAVECVAAHPCAFTACERKGADVVELFAQLALVHQIGKAHVLGAVDEGEGDLGVGFVAEHGLAHQEFVEVGVDERPHDWVDLPFVVPDAGGDVGHRSVPYG